LREIAAELEHAGQQNGLKVMAGKDERGKRVAVVGYLRTSSNTNVGEGKDSEARQRKAIEGYAKAAGMVIVDWFYDAAVSGADPIEARSGFAALLARIASNGDPLLLLGQLT
jgi:DNA invertase Pin-like site-specific DNA recombinase